MSSIPGKQPRWRCSFASQASPKAMWGKSLNRQLSGRPENAVVTPAWVALAGILLAHFLLLSASGFGEARRVLVTAKQVRALAPQQASRGVPVHIRGQVILLSGWKNSFFFSDGHFGISIDRNDVFPELHSGDEVEVRGKTSAGLFAPIIVSDQIRVLGNAKLPLPPLRSYSDLADGSEDSQWVRVRGVVHAAWIAPSWGKNILFLTVDMGGVEMSARVNEFTGRDPSHLVDAEVMLRGVCGTNFNEARQFVKPRLFVANLEAVEVTKAAPTDPFRSALQPLESLRRFGLGRTFQHRIRVAGTVTYQKPGYGLYIQQDTAALFIETAQPTRVAVGTRIDAIGFGASGPYSPQLHAASFRIAGRGDELPAARLHASDIIRPDANGFVTSPYDGRLVQLQGRLIEQIFAANEEVLAMADGSHLFRAVLTAPVAHGALSGLKAGSELDLRGVISIQSDETGEPQVFVLKMRTPGDVSVVQAASWWDRRHTAFALCAVTSVALGCVVLIVLLRRKVSQQAHAVQESLELSEAARKAQADQTFALDQHACVSITDVHGTIQYVNDKFCALAQYERKQLIGQSHRIFNSGHHGEEFFRQLYRKITHGEVWHGEVRNRASNGSFYWVDAAIVPTLDAQGRPRQYISIQTDITDRKRAAEELKATQQNLGLALGAGKMGAFELNLETGDLWTSVEHARIFGYDTPRRDFNRTFFLEHVFPPDRDTVKRTLDQASQAGQVAFECRITRLDNEVRWISVAGKDYCDEYHKPVRRAGVVQDISDRKRAEEEIHRLNVELEARLAERTAELIEANQEMEAFTYTAAHDLRAPLRHMNGFVEVLRQSWFERMDVQGQRYLEKISTASQDMGVLLDDLLNFSRLSRTKIQVSQVVLNQVMARIREELAPDWRGRAVTWTMADLPVVEGDPSLLHQVFLNLLANAVKYTRKCKRAHIEVGCHQEAGEVTVCVRDNGAGFEMEYVDKLFHVFQRLHKAQEFEGTGIGLAIVRRIVERHGGRVRAEGAPNHGAAFYISLPMKGDHHGQIGPHSVGGR